MSEYLSFTPRSRPRFWTRGLQLPWALAGGSHAGQQGNSRTGSRGLLARLRPGPAPASELCRGQPLGEGEGRAGPARDGGRRAAKQAGRGQADGRGRRSALVPCLPTTARGGDGRTADGRRRPWPQRTSPSRASKGRGRRDRVTA